jgi:hypothetical protein
MSRAASGDTVVLKPANNIYTVLVVAATLAVILGLVVLFMRVKPLLGDNASLF